MPVSPPLPRSIAAVMTSTLITLTGASTAAEIAPVAPGKTGLKGPERQAEPRMQPASDAPQKAMVRFQAQEGFKIDLWAAEPMLANPVAFTIAGDGKIYVSETYRYKSSTLDIRHYMFMLEDDLACRTTDDRIAAIKRHFPAEWQKLEIEGEVVRLLEDRKGSGMADFSSPYATGMNTMLDGINSGVLVHDGKVWCTNIPHLWQFSGLNKEGRAEKRESLSSGYGVHFSYTGHDMHGLALGPDGRIYFTFGDRGAHVITKEGKTLAFPDEGAVFRCEPDGSHMEAFARGLRNPQELAFDNHGNLFTADNDSDQGDRERWVCLVDGSDSGWRIGWQHNPLGKQRNPWLAEKMWEPRRADSPAYILSPVMNVADGPSGICHNPGTGLPSEYDDDFFICGFKGSSARSSITSLRVKESGAGFATVKPVSLFLGGVQATDVAFGPDSKVYFSEWGEGWESSGQGRIFSMGHTAALEAQASQVAEVKKLLGEGFSQRVGNDLAKLLGHPDQRIRLNAQWALADQADGTAKLLDAALKSGDPLARLHGIWGLSHVARRVGYKTPAAEAQWLAPLLGLLTDPDAEVRAQTAKALGEGKVGDALQPLLNSLKDENLRVRFFAAQSLGKLSRPETAQALVELLRENADKDEFLRHAAVGALVATGNTKALAAAAKDESRSVRLGALLAMRRLRDPQIAQFTTDSDPFLVKEAARAINDEDISDAFPALAQLLSNPSPDEQLMLRAINASFRLGSPAAAQALVRFAAADSLPDTFSVEALTLLGSWAKPFARDRVTGLYRPLADRDSKVASAALKAGLPKLLAAKAPATVSAAIDTLRALDMKDESPALFALLANSAAAHQARAKALDTLAHFNNPKLPEAIQLAISGNDHALRIQAITLLAQRNPDEAAKQLVAVFASSGIPEKKAVINALGDIKSAGSEDALAGLVGDLIAGKVPGEVQLEVLEAAAKRGGASVKAQLTAYKENLSKGGDLLAAYEPTLLGGNKEAGEKLFKEHAVAACMRCHKIAGSGGDAGPDLSGLARTKDRRYILESIVAPNAQIAEGFQSVLVTLKNGEMQVGVIKKETDTELTLQMPVPGAPATTARKADIKSRENTPSGMPPNLADLLSKREIRDIVEYVASLK